MSPSYAILARLGLALLIQIVSSTLSYACLDKNDPLYVACTEETTLTPLFRTVFGPQTRPRRIAVVMSISSYPNLPKKALASAGADGKMLTQTLKNLQYDEIIKISDQDFNEQNLERIFTRYLPPLLQKQMNSQVFVTFSGHGNEYEDEGYLLLPIGKKLEISEYSDTTDGWLSMRRLRDILFNTVKYANQSLILINACKSGNFVTPREYYGSEDAISKPTAQVITAGGPADFVEADPDVGSFGGSIFFEMVNSALSNTPLRTPRGPMPPPNNDGILSFWTLFSFLHDTSLALSNRTIAPIPAAFMNKTQPPQAEGAYFFIVDKERAKQALARRFADNYRTIFGNAAQQRPSAVAEPQPRLFSAAEFLSKVRLGIEHATSIDYVQSLLGTPVYRTLTRAHFERDGYLIDAKMRDSGDDRGFKGAVVALKVMTMDGSDGSGRPFALSGFPGIEQDFARVSRSAEVGKNTLSDFLAASTHRCDVDYWGALETNTFLCYFDRGEEFLSFKLYLDTHGLSEADKSALYSFFKILNHYRYPNKDSDSHAWDVADDEVAEEKKVGVLNNSAQGKMNIAGKKIVEIASKMRVVGVQVISPQCIRDLDTDDRPDTVPVTDKHAKPEAPG